MDQIKILRTRIDSLDDEIMELLQQRFNIVLAIGSAKSEQKKAILDSSREDFILDKASKYSHSPQIKTVYSSIMSEAKILQRK